MEAYEKAEAAMNPKTAEVLLNVVRLANNTLRFYADAVEHLAFFHPTDGLGCA